MSEELKVKVVADTAPLQSGMRDAPSIVDRATARIREAFARMRAQTRSDTEAMVADTRRAGSAIEDLANSAKGLVLGFAGFQGIKALVGLSDQAALSAARMQQVTGGLEQARQASQALFELSQRMQAPIAETQAMFARMLPAVKELKGGVREATALSEILISTAKLGGASAAEAAAGAQQFAQALGSGVLQGDELKSILENNQTLARELAGALGVTIGQLRKMGEEGKLTSDLVANALLGRYDQIRAQTANLPQTVGGAFIKITNAATQLWGAMNTGEGVMATVARVFSEIANVIELVTSRLKLMGGESSMTAEQSKKLAQAMGAAFAFIVDVVSGAVGVIKSMGDGIGAIFAAISAAMSGNYRGAANILAESFGKAKEAGSAALDALMGKGRTLQAYMAVSASGGDFSNEGRNASGGAFAKLQGSSAPKKTGEDKSRVELWESQLAAAEAAIQREGMLEGQYRQRSLADNLAFYQQLLQRKDLNEKEKQQLTKKTAEVEMAMVKESFDLQVRVLQGQAAEYRNNMAEKIRIEEQIQAKYQQGTKEYEAAQQRINALQRQAAAQTAQVAQIRADAEIRARLAVVDIEEQTLRTAAQLGLITNLQLLEQAAQFEERRSDIARQALQQRLAIAMQDPDRDPVRIAQIQAAIEELERQHQQRLGAIRGQMAVESVAPMTRIFQSVESALASSMDKMLQRQMTFKQAVGSIWGAVRQTIMAELARIIVAKAAAWAKERMLTMAGIGADAAKAGSGAAASQASIPYVGPILAIAAMAAVMASVMGAKASVPSARGGFDIPAGVNPLTQLHEREMVLPEAQADAVRDMAAGGGQPIHIHGSPDDSIKLRDLPKVLKQLGRDHVFVGR